MPKLLALAPDLATTEDILEFAGVFVSFSIAYVAGRGLRQTQSPALLRLATAFAFLGFGFLVEAVVELQGLVQSVPVLTATVAAGLAIVGPLMETTGYFFLAFSHAVDVIFAKRLGAALIVFPVLSLSTTQAIDSLSLLSFYFILYGVLETVYAYSHSRNPDALLTATGLSFLGAGTFFPLLSLLYTKVYLLSLLQIILKEMGLAILFIPVLSYALGRTRINGPI
jgi:hypothetical protein